MNKNKLFLLCKRFLGLPENRMLYCVSFTSVGLSAFIYAVILSHVEYSPKMSKESFTKLIYKAGLTIFEDALEYNLDYGVNGRHMAEKLSAFFAESYSELF